MKTKKTFTRNWLLNLFPVDSSSAQVKDGFREKLLRAPIFKEKNGEITFRIPGQRKTEVKGREVRSLISSLINELTHIFEMERAAEQAFSSTNKRLICIQEDISACQAELLRNGVLESEDEIQRIIKKIERWRSRISKKRDENDALQSRNDLTKNLYSYFQIHVPNLSQNQIIYCVAAVFFGLGENGSIDKVYKRVARQFFQGGKRKVPKAVFYGELPMLKLKSEGTSILPPKRK